MSTRPEECGNCNMDHPSSVPCPKKKSLVEFYWEHILSTTRGPEAMTVVYDREAERIVSAKFEATGQELEVADLLLVNESIEHNIGLAGSEELFFAEVSAKPVG